MSKAAEDYRKGDEVTFRWNGTAPRDTARVIEEPVPGDRYVKVRQFGLPVEGSLPIAGVALLDPAWIEGKLEPVLDWRRR